ncbi:MAG: GH92 family glycosyl hydrolase [Sphingomonas sp.]|nr:GH92 family glycosyl hydrolase [Sphingomonas sp.]
MRVLFAVFWLFLAGPVLARPAAHAPQPVDYVDPFIGTDGTGHTSPAASRPFGMVQPGPDNAGTGWAYTSGYQYRAPDIVGFSQNRASGTGIPELGDVLLQPSQTRRDSFVSRYDKASERARPGYYAVTLADNGVRVELTASLRAAFHRYTFDKGGRVWVLVDLQHGLTFLTDRQPVLSNQTESTPFGLEGVSHRRNWTTRTIAFSLEFDHRVAERITLPSRPDDAAPRYLLGFDLGNGHVLEAKIGLANTDVAGARLNRSEISDWNFDRVAAEARAEWNALLVRATIEGPRDQQRIFATALYHAFLHPSVISDCDGRWRGPDELIHTAKQGLRYSTFSLWDSFRAAMPLYTLLVPERVDDFANSLLDHADASGRLPLWPIWGGETGTMIGEPALPVLADAWAKGFRGFDGPRALAAMIRTSSEDHALSQWSIFDRYGYYPYDKVEGEAVSRTLEASIGDDAVARMATMLGDKAAASRFASRAQGWRKLIDPETRLARGRDSAGKWRTPFDPLKPTSPLNNPGDYTEANAWQYSWTPALLDPQGLAAAMGGTAAFQAMLDRFFFGLKPSAGAEYLGQEALIGQYAHGNEPSHHIAWLYAYTDHPEIGHQLVSRIARSFYKDSPAGIIGNEDAGQMSAWYVFASLGFYPAQPASGQYVAGIPLVRRARLAVPGHTPLLIERIGEGDRLVRVTAAGQPLAPTAMPHRALNRGGTLRFVTANGLP